MSQKYTNWDDLCCEWVEATSSIMEYIEKNEPIDSTSGWNFEEGVVMNNHTGDYSVYIAYIAYDTSLSSSVRLHVQAFTSPDKGIKVKTNKRELVNII